MVFDSYFVVAYGPATHGSIALVRERFDSLNEANARFAALVNADSCLPDSCETTFRILAEFHTDRALDSVTDQELRMLVRSRGVLPDGLIRIHFCRPRHVPHPAAIAVARGVVSLPPMLGLFLPRPTVIDAATGQLREPPKPGNPVVFDVTGQDEEYPGQSDELTS